MSRIEVCSRIESVSSRLSNVTLKTFTTEGEGEIKKNRPKFLTLELFNQSLTLF